MLRCYIELAKERIKAAEGAQELMIFSVFDYGAALNMVNARQTLPHYRVDEDRS